MFRPATQTHSHTEMVVDGFQLSKVTTKTAGIRYVTLREDYLKEVDIVFFLCFEVMWEAWDPITGTFSV